jgi:23S rRNA (uridine2552-2'-O)-methyltransferase
MDRPKKHRFNKAWMHEHVTDHWVQEARRLGYRSRAAFKLQEIDAKDRLFRPGMKVVDLGAAPGSWSQYAAARVKPGGDIIALDLLEMAPLPGVRVLRGDFGDEEVLSMLEAALAGAKIDLVLSDMAPNLSGVDGVDQARSIQLAELALDFANKWLQPGGRFLVKSFQGEGFPEFQRQLRQSFREVHARKPKASRDRSREVYLLGKGFLGAGTGGA